jgi:ABC-type polysaccharide/polyol phosphate export permease
MGSAGSIVGNSSLVTHINFPRELLTTATVLANGVNFLLASLVLLPVLWALGISPTTRWLLFPVVFSGQALFVLGLGLAVAASNVLYRDTTSIIEVLLQAWIFLTPVFYDLSQISRNPGASDLANFILIVNPMALTITLYRSVLLGLGTPDPTALLVSWLTGLIVFCIGYARFRQVASRFGDML